MAGAASAPKTDCRLNGSNKKVGSRRALEAIASTSKVCIRALRDRWPDLASESGSARIQSHRKLNISSLPVTKNKAKE
jgi:hypothetical protein